MKPIVAAVTLTTLISACSEPAPSIETLRPVKTVTVQYDDLHSANRYFATVASRHEVDQAFRVGGKVIERRVDVGQRVNAGDLLAVLDAADYRLAEEAARQRLDAARATARQAESDWQRLKELKKDGSVSISHEEQAHSALLTAKAGAEAEARQLELARNQVAYTVLRAPLAGVVTSLHLEIGQVVAPGQPVITIANEGEPEIVADVPENYLDAFKASRYRAVLASAPDDYFEVELRELSAQAAAQTRTYRARLKPVVARQLPLGASATLIAEHRAVGTQVATIPAAALTQNQGQPAVWAVRPDDSKVSGVVELAPIVIEGYRNDEILVSGPADGTQIIAAGVQKMAPGLRVALPVQSSGATTKEAAQ